jgi:hypothetical protein
MNAHLYAGAPLPSITLMFGGARWASQFSRKMAACRFRSKAALLCCFLSLLPQLDVRQSPINLTGGSTHDTPLCGIRPIPRFRPLSIMESCKL